MRLLLDEMYPATLADQLRERGHDVASLHDPEHRRLEGSPDEEVFATAVDEHRCLVTENVADFRRLESVALANGEAHPSLVFTTNRQFPRGEGATLGRLVVALDALLVRESSISGALFLKPE